MSFRKDKEQGAAWLSSARAVRCWVKSRNERNPYFSCRHVMVGTLKRLPAQAERKEGMTSSHHGPYAQGYTRATMAYTKCCKLAIASQSQKVRLSSDCRLQLACMKLESLVIVDQQCYGEYVPGPCTHRPSSHGSREDLKAVAVRRCLG